MDIQPGGQGPPGQPPGGGGRRGPEQQPQDRISQDVLNTLAGLVAQNLTQRQQREETGSAQPSEQELQTQQRIGRLIQESRALSFTLNENEISFIGRDIDSAATQIENWLGQIEANEQYYTSESINQNVEQKINVSLAWLYTLTPERHGVMEERGTPNGDNPQTKIEKYHRKKNQLLEDATVRLDLHNIKKAIGQADLKLIGEFATKIGMHGVMHGFDIKNSRIAFNLYQRYFERHLYNYGKLNANPEKGIKEITGVFKDRISPQLINNTIRKEVQEDLAANFELYGFESAAEALIAEKIGYSLFSASQRKGVHVSRGNIILEKIEESSTYHKYYKTEGFTSDPDEILDNLYNPLEFQLRKWSRPSEAQKKVLNEIMTFMGEGDLTAGEQRFIDSLALSDLFTSGWRLGYILESVKRRTEAYRSSRESDDAFKARQKSIATGMRLKAGAGHSAKEADIIEQLGNVATYRPLELLKTYITDIDRYGKEYQTKSPQREAIKARLKRMFADGEFRTSSGKPITNYVELEEVLGRYVYPIYEKGIAGARLVVINGVEKLVSPDSKEGKELGLNIWESMRGIDIGAGGNAENSAFNQDDMKIIDEVVTFINQKIDASGDPNTIQQKLTSDDLISLYKKVQDIVGSQEAKADMYKGRTLEHSQLFARTLYLDDVPLDRLARTEELKGGQEDLMLASKFNDVRGGGRDSYRRIWNDTSSAFSSNEEFMKAINSTKTEQLFESLMKGSQAMSGYGGKEPALQLAYNIAGGWLKLAMGDPMWRYLSLHDKLPIKTSELERLFGEGAASLSLEEAHHLIENMKLIFGDMTHDDHRITHAFERVEKEIGLHPWQVWLSRTYIIMFLLTLGIFAKLADEIKEATTED